MSFSRTHVLLTEDHIVGVAAGTDSPVPRFFPPNQMEFPHAREVTFTISVAGVSGSPVAWSLGAKFQFCQVHTSGLYLANPRWFDLQPEQISTLIAEGAGWYGGAHTKPSDGGYGIIANQTDTLPLTVQRTVKAGFGQRVRVLTNPQFTPAASTGTATFTASGGVVTTSAAHGLAVNDLVTFGAVTTTTGVTAANPYKVVTVPSSTTFTVKDVNGLTVTMVGDGSTASVTRYPTLNISATLTEKG